MKIEIFSIQFDNLDMDEVLEKVRGFLNDRSQHYIVLPYSEFVVRAQKNEGFRKILNQADLCLCESRGLYLVARILKKKLKQEINGIELIYNIVKNFKFSISNVKAFLFGAEGESITRAAEELGNNVVGFEDRHQNHDLVIKKVNLIGPEILLVGLGSPEQEKFIIENLSKMPSVKLAIGVGGAFDFISWQIKRAPKIMQKIGLEWLWRLILQPKRINRIFKGVGGLLVLTIKNMLLFKIVNKKVV